ncbi:hypothetical protein AB0O07_21060 [Streptomyces sp. NPDC093085]|uniref:hypothetical protein n=1 Tax=Streptomyces sp. NPDC093085 TaxID=3155068 RepID=UPI00342C8AFE
MSTLSLALLLTTATATAVGVAALHAAHSLRRQVSALRGELATAHPGGLLAAVPQARSAAGAELVADTDVIRAAVAEALAEERERELAEARAFWAAQEARDAADAPSMLGGLPGFGAEETPFYVPRQMDFAGLESLESLDSLDSLEALESLDLDATEAFDDLTGYPDHTGTVEFAEDSPELAAARRRHPSHPDFVPVQTPVVTDHERTVARLEELARARTALADVRPGPLGTLDVYVFADGTTLCMTPGHRETAERLSAALREGEAPFLLGGSGVSGAYSLTFACGGDRFRPDDTTGAEHVYILADRVIASL